MQTRLERRALFRGRTLVGLEVWGIIPCSQYANSNLNSSPKSNQMELLQVHRPPSTPPQKK